MSDPSELFTRVFIRINQRFANIYSLRQIAQLGLPMATYMLHKETSSFVKEIVYDPKNENLFTDKSAILEQLGGIDGMTSAMASSQVNTFQIAIDAASLVFAHSILDDTALEYCRITSLIAPNDWEGSVTKRKVDVAEVKTKPYDSILRELIDDYMLELENKSMLAKIDKLFAICQPPAGFSRMKDYSFRRDQIEMLDKMRHDIVHGDGAVHTLPNGGDDIWYMNQTCHHLMALVNNKYSLRIDPKVFIKYYSEKR